jgi:UDP-N-acetylglucosamine diphosphorylase / glucose-1-phosphate thymidylyltransferase / UDP-N-acetylgalactosamine diphosphorylase / glucosamine-1-phosphate N-acetyltransferase / galactosamine-1-phosphate N-acetyltransferase
MINLILFDTPASHLALRPISLTRPIALFRIGIDTVAEKWQLPLQCKISYLTENYLAKKYPCHYSSNNFYVKSNSIPSVELLEIVANLGENEAVFYDDELLAYSTNEQLEYDFDHKKLKFNNKIILKSLVAIRQLSDIFVYNGKLITADFQRITATISSNTPTDSFTDLYYKSQIFFGQNVSCKAAVLDASNGPIFIDDNAQIDIGALIQGPAYIGKNSIVALGAKIRPNTTVGPFCKVGGEVGMSVLMGYSNKGHDGFMGCAVIGEWCNWGAGTNNSNLKNDFGTVHMHSYTTGGQKDTGQLFAGLVMADYSKTAIGTLFNTGTVVGVCCNVFTSGFTLKHLPSFSWGGGPANTLVYRLPKALEVIEKTMARRNSSLSQADVAILQHIFDISTN